MNGLAGCSVSTIGKPHEYFDLTGTAERWVGSCRRELLEHVVVLGACHLIRLVRAYISYYHEDRCHLGLNKDTPSLRAVTHRPSPTAKVVALPRVGGLHHRYEWREAA